MRREQIEQFLDEVCSQKISHLSEEYAFLEKADRKLPKHMLGLPRAEFDRELRKMVLAGSGGPVNACDELGWV